MYEIALTEDAQHDLTLLPAHLRVKVLDRIEQQLRHEPLRTSRNRKPLKGALAPRWELRVGEHRIFYRLAEDTIEVLRIMRKGRKTTENLK